MPLRNEPECRGDGSKPECRDANLNAMMMGVNLNANCYVDAAQSSQNGALCCLQVSAPLGFIL